MLLWQLRQTLTQLASLQRGQILIPQLRSRAQQRSSVDLPQPLGPSNAVIRPTGKARERDYRTGLLVYPALSPVRVSGIINGFSLKARKNKGHL